MEWFDSHLLTGLTFLPLVFGVLLLLIPAKGTQGKAILKYGALIATLVVFAASLQLWNGFNAAGDEFQFREAASWIPSLGVNYLVGIDGISLLLILLTTFMMPIVILASFTTVETREKEYYFLLLMLQTGMIGAFTALDTFLFYVFWEAMLIPMYFLIGIWGGKDRIYAAMKFFLYTMVGSLLMLTAIFYLAYQHKLQFGSFSTAVVDLYKLKIDATGGYFSTQGILFIAFALSFAIKVPLFPLHTWLPDAHVQAPTAGSVILAGVLLKMGGYGFIRFAFPLFPQAVQQYQIFFMLLSAIAIIYGAWVATIQPDIKKLVAYSSVSHMGYVVLGLFSMNAIGATGAVYQMLNHGISTGGLFLLVGMIYERRHTREISEFGGITKVMPLFAISLMIMTLSSVALPGTNGFIGEFLILLGAWKANMGIAAISTLGVIFGAVYMLWMFQRVMFGPLKNPENKKLTDLGLREVLVMLPLIVAVFVMGVAPNAFFGKMEPSIQKLLTRVQPVAAAPVAMLQERKGN
ncbi:MAG: NADH-quinone oxidoreductase subunit M [Bdellovibrionales bacterium]|nr:NADH-quinone oxidoreductase subunit M [Bdellovibrionales bacterium]